VHLGRRHTCPCAARPVGECLCSSVGEQVRVQAGDEFGEVLAADGLPGADLNVTTRQGVVVGVIGGYEQGGCTPVMSYSTQVTSNLSALCASAVADG
jgi:hypothetical protein